jgi:hypothetical protein
MDSCSEWYIAKRTRLLGFWILGGLFLGVLAFYINWKFGLAWSVLAVLGFIVGEKLLMRRVDHSAPR